MIVKIIIFLVKIIVLVKKNIKDFFFKFASRYFYALETSHNRIVKLDKKLLYA